MAQDQRTIAEQRDDLDARDHQPVDMFHPYFAGVVTGLIYGAFVAYLVFGR